jgi:alanine dehydrogenase
LKVLTLSSRDIEPLIGMEEALPLAERAYALQGRIKSGKLQSCFSPLVAYEVKRPSLGYSGFFDFRSGYVEEVPIMISTMGYGYPENKLRRGLPGVFAVSVVSDVDTGAPLAIMEADHLASMRTGAAGAVASKYLAKKDSHGLAFIGSGHLAKNMLDAHIKAGFPIETVKVWSRNSSNREEFAKRASQAYGIEALPAGTPREAVTGADIVCCCTPSLEPRVMRADVKPGMHINAFGADSPGKQEVDPGILRSSMVVVDSLEQCALGGEIHKALASGLITREDIYAEIGEIVVGEKHGRVSQEEVTLMDATGLAVQDLVIFHEAYKIALQKGVGTWIQL